MALNRHRPHLQHNQQELARLTLQVKPFLL